MAFGIVEMLERNKLVEHPIVQHEEHCLVGGVILNAKEALGSIIRFHIVHLRAGNKAFVLFTIGRERHTSVEEHFKVGPHLIQSLLARNFKHTMNHSHHPRRHT